VNWYVFIWHVRIQLIAEISKVDGLYCDFISGILTILIQDTFSRPASKVSRGLDYYLNGEAPSNGQETTWHGGYLVSELIRQLVQIRIGELTSEEARAPRGIRIVFFTSGDSERPRIL
jgi:hypothetical protein